MTTIRVKFRKPSSYLQPRYENVYTGSALFWSNVTLGAEISFEVLTGCGISSYLNKCKIDNYIQNLANCTMSGSRLEGEGDLWKTDAQNCQKILDAVLKASDTFELELDNFMETVKLLESNGYLTSDQVLNYEEQLDVKNTTALTQKT